MKSLWKGDKPTPADLVSYLGEPLQLQLMIGHAKKSPHYFSLGENTVVAVVDVEHDEMTTASIAKLFSVDEKWAERESEVVARAVRDARRRLEQQSVLQADRAWRVQQRRR